VPSRRVFTKYSKSKFSQNTTNILSIKVATCFDSSSHHQANYWTMHEVHQVKVHIFGIPKYLQQWGNVGTNEVDIYNIICIKIYPCVNIYNIVNINIIYTHILSLLLTFWDPKNVHFHLIYLKHGSIIFLMITVWVETCRHFDNKIVVFWLNLLLEYLHVFLRLVYKHHFWTLY